MNQKNKKLINILIKKYNHIILLYLLKNTILHKHLLKLLNLQNKP